MNIHEIKSIVNKIIAGKSKKIGIDIHGVITAYPEDFSEIIDRLMNNGHEVHIVTGARLSSRLIKNLLQLNVRWSSMFSIVSYHEAIGTKVTYDNCGRPWMDEQAWIETKGLYAKNIGLDYHIDDSEIYGKYFDYETIYLLLK